MFEYDYSIDEEKWKQFQKMTIEQRLAWTEELYQFLMMAMTKEDKERLRKFKSQKYGNWNGTLIRFN